MEEFWKVWEDLGADPWVVFTIKEGYNLEFHNRPPWYHNLSSTWTANILRPAPSLKRWWTKVLWRESLHQYSRLLQQYFSGYQKDRRSRPVIDLKPLNTFWTPFCPQKKFKMETAQTITSVNKSVWVFSIDTYFHSPIHPSSKKFLRISWERSIPVQSTSNQNLISYRSSNNWKLFSWGNIHVLPFTNTYTTG